MSFIFVFQVLFKIFFALLKYLVDYFKICTLLFFDLNQNWDVLTNFSI